MLYDVLRVSLIILNPKTNTEILSRFMVVWRSHVVANSILVGSKPSTEIAFEESFAFGSCRA